MDDKYKTFRCQKCLLHKKMSLFSHYEKNKQGKRAICTNCASRILEAANKRMEGVRVIHAKEMSEEEFKERFPENV